MKLARSIEDANLLMDSTDCPIVTAPDRGPQTEYWSGKSNCNAQRFMVITDFQGRIQEVFGGYSPKVYDAHFVQIMKSHFVKNYSKAIFLADNHFSSVNDYFEYPKFYCPTRETNTNSDSVDPETQEGLNTLTKKQQMKNNAIRVARGKVERPFAVTKTKFQALEEKWKEELPQLTYLFFVACAVHNEML